jgi:hypothetical protein
MSRLPSWLVGKNNAIREPEPPPIADRLHDRLALLGQSYRRRLSDHVEAVFEEACLSGDLDTAEDLLRVLERMQARADAIAAAGGRRRAALPIGRLRGDLAAYVERQAERERAAEPAR